MKQRVRLAAAGAAALAAGALVAGPASASAHGGGHGAVFVQTDNTSGNSIAVYDRAPDGALAAAGSYATGGLGGVLAGSAVDHLASQGSLALDRRHGLLYAVNAGSDSLTVFKVHGDRLHATQVTGSGGTFPVSVTTHGNLVYVLNARDGGSVQGYLRIGNHLIRVPSWNRGLGLDPTATPEFTHTPGQVSFTPDGRHLVVTTKANGNDIDIFAVTRYGALEGPTVYEDTDAVPFAVTYDAAGHLLVAEAGTNSVSTFRLGRDGTLTLLATAATGQAATCWIAGTGRTFFASNAGSATLSGYRAHADGQLTATGAWSTDAGTVDASVTPNDRFLYAQAGAAGNVDGFRIHPDGSLSPVGSVTVPGAAGGEGIVAE
ncbi:MAG: lactonase family protein [Nocardioidaceae bacterium]